MKRYVFHNIHALTVSLLVITGGLLYSSALRLALSEVRALLRDAHILLGFVLIVSLLGAVWLSRKRTICTRASYRLSALFCTGSALTGVLLLLRFNLGNIADVPVISLHRLVALAGTIILGLHVYHVWAKKQKKTETLTESGVLGSSQSAITDRRRFVKWLAALGAMAGIGLFANHLRSKNDEIPGTMQSKFEDCNKMTPLPNPSLGSVPPIGGGYKGQFEVFTVTKIPCSNSETWRFTVSGLVDKPVELNWEQFLQVPRKVQVSNFHCITGWSVYNVTYEGISIPALLDMVGAKPDGLFVKFSSGDGIYTSALSIEQARMNDVIIAVLMDGNPIPSSLGGPARLVVPQMYAYKGVKWLTGLEVIDSKHIGFWESRGYENDAWVRKGV